MHSPQIFYFRFMNSGLARSLAVAVACSSSPHQSLTKGGPGTVVSAQTGSSRLFPPMMYPCCFRLPRAPKILPD